MDALVIILIGSFVAISCGLLGSFLVLRKMVMMGDAISHAVLPGIVVAFLVAGDRNNFVLLFGAALVGLLCVYLIELFHQKARLQEDAAIGISFTLLFAIGVILISLYTGQVDLDQECVLYGELAYAPLDNWHWGSLGNLGPRALWITGAMLLLVIVAVWRGYRGLFITTFQPEYAASLGFNTARWHWFLMSLVSFTTVFSFESVGAILVVAFLVAPPATAFLLTTDLRKMLILTAVIGVICATAGYYLALVLDANIAGAMVTVAGLLFFSAFFIKKILE
jgi:manganese/zinc/iron transport system permease protein